MTEEEYEIMNDTDEATKKKRSLAYYKEEIKADLARLEAKSAAKEVAGKSIGKHGLLYITIIVTLGVVASIHLEEAKIAAVMGLLSASLTALIHMLSSIAGATEKEDRPEFEVIKSLIEKLDRLDRAEPPMQVDVDNNNVTVRRGDDTVKSSKADKGSK